MKAKLSGGIGCAAFLACATAFAQTPQPQSTTPSASGNEVTITGCVQREADFRRARDAGKGGVAGTGVGSGNEFVLINAADTKSSTATGAATPTGTSGGTIAATEYELTGPNEGKLADHIGKRVEIRGMLKAAETGVSGQPTGGATAGKPPAGVDVTSKDLKLRELEVTSVREVSGTCPAGK